MNAKSDANGPLRLFLGTSLSGEARQALEEVYQHRGRLTKLWDCKISWVRPETYHMTWLFIGEVPPKKVASIIRRTEQALAGISAIDLHLERLVFWPNAQKPRLLVWHGEDTNSAIQALAHQFTKAFPGYADKKPFRPHITLARFRSPPDQSCGSLSLPEDIGLLPHHWLISEVTLFSSTLTPHGAIHTPVQTWPLSG